MSSLSFLEKVRQQRSRYRILGQVGQGQSGRVYCAVHRQTGDLVALKDLSQMHLPTHKFLRELSCLVSLRHTNIVSCYALEHHSRGRYLVMDYCEGGTLRDLMESQGKLSLVHSLKLVTDILLGLEHAHSRHIIHCDIKPENILLTLTSSGWTARISDFGIARLTQETGLPDIGRGYTGSPAYMAPERFYGKYSRVSDIYSVGVLLFELLTGERPFSGIPGELMSAHLNQRLTIPPTVPFILRSTLATALQKLPQRRFASVEEMLQAVRLATEVLQAQKPSGCFFSAVERGDGETGRGKTFSLQATGYEILRRESLTTPVTHLAVAGQSVYRGTAARLCCYTYADADLGGEPLQQWQVRLNGSLSALSIHMHGCLALTHTFSQYSLYYVSPAPTPTDIQARPLFSLPSRKLISAIAPKGDWIAIASQAKLTQPSATFQVFKLPSLAAVTSSIHSSIPAQLIALDNHHGLAVFLPKSQLSQKTVFSLFNRRGSWIEAFSLPYVVHSITANITSLYSLLALEKCDPCLAVLINLKPLKITRIALEITPDFIVDQAWGYILANRQGEVILLDSYGGRLGKFEVPGNITAIAACTDAGILIATWLDKAGMLYQVKLDQSFIRQ